MQERIESLMVKLKVLSESTILSENSIQNNSEGNINWKDWMKINKDCAHTLWIKSQSKSPHKEIQEEKHKSNDKNLEELADLNKCIHKKNNKIKVLLPRSSRVNENIRLY